MTSANDELRARAGDAHEPYRALLRGVRDGLRSTRAWVEQALATKQNLPAPPAAIVPVPRRSLKA